MDDLTATEFLKSLQAAVSSSTGISPRLHRDTLYSGRDALLTDPSFNESERQGMRDFVNADDEGDAVRRFAVEFIGSLPHDVAETVRHIPVGTLPVTDFNGATIPAPSGGSVVVVATGLFATLVEVSKWLVAGLPGIGGTPAETTLPESIKGACMWTTFHMLGSPLPRRFGLLRNPERRGMQSAIWMNALFFVLGHEFGHALLRHGDPKAHGGIPAERGEPVAVEVFARSRQHEFEADAKGSELTLASSTTVNGNVIPGCMGVEFALRLIQLAEHMHPNRRGLETHPPAAERRARLHSLWRTEHGELPINIPELFADYFDPAERWGRAVIDRLKSQGRI